MQINKNGFLQSWPGLYVNQYTKYTLIYEATVRGHMNAQLSNIHSTKKYSLNFFMDTIILTPSPIHNFSKKKSYVVILRDNTLTGMLTP